MAKRFHFYENPNPTSVTRSQEDKDAWFGTKPEDGDAFWAKRIPGLREAYGPAHEGTKEIDTEPHDMFYCDIAPLPPVIHIDGGKTFPLPLAVIAAVVATVFYLINCNTAYFSNLGVNAVIVGCLIVAIVLELVYIIGYNKVGVSLVMDVLPLVCGALMMVAFAQFITARVNSIATILSFERNAQTMSDLSSAIIGMICCFVAILLNIIGSYFKVVKTEE